MSLSSDLPYRLQLDPKTAGALWGFSRRRRLLLIFRAVAAGIVFFVGTMAIVAACDYLWLLSDGVRWLLSLLGYAVTLGATWWFGFRHLGSSDPRLVARQLESADPRLREDLLSAVELADPEDANGSESFRQRLQHDVARRASALDIGHLLPVGLVQRWFLACVVIVACCFVMLAIPQIQFGRRIARAMLPLIPIERASLTELTILKPSPPSGYVAEGDAVGVTVKVEGTEVDEVWMQWRSDEGVDGETIMTARITPDTVSQEGTLRHDNVFAANLSIGTTPVEYRIMAGDAITLWHELTPLPRPRVESFQKRYVFPAYTKLDDRIEESEHGDLKALVGTRAEVTVRFDEPVDEASLRFGNRGVTFHLEPVEGADRDYRVTIPIRTPANYQIDAMSRRSGLDNPFSPQYSVTPVIDTAPTARWAPEIGRTIIVSPLDVVKLHVNVSDDLPMESVIQEFKINEDAVIRRTVKVETSGRELDLRWDWDLLRRSGNEEESIQLSGGDIIRTRIVAVDRHKQRGESGFIELLVAEEGFDSTRHDHLENFSRLTSSIGDWAASVKTLMDPMREVAEKRQLQPFAAGEITALELHQQQTGLSQSIRNAIESSDERCSADTLELIGRALLDVDHEMSRWFRESRWAFDQDAEVWRANRDKTLRDLGNQARRLSLDASRIEQYAHAVFGEELTVGIVGDAISLERSLQPLIATDAKIPADRLPRHLAVSVGRLDAISDLIEKHQKALPESTRRHLEHWTRWSDPWSARLQASVKEPPNEEAYRALVLQFKNELANQHRHAMLDGRLSSTLVKMLREIRMQIGSSGDSVRLLQTHGETARKMRQRAEKEGNSDNAARFNRDADLSDFRFAISREGLLDRLEQEETLHRSRPNVDLRYAADLHLMHRAIDNVTKEGFVPYREEPAQEVHRKLATAFQTLEAKHEIDMWWGEIRDLMLAERRLEPNAVSKLKHATQIERFGVGMEWPLKVLKSSGLDWATELKNIDHTRYSDSFSQARERITSRRWGKNEKVTAEAPLETLERKLTSSVKELAPSTQKARDTIRQYVLTLSEQAREAAEKAKEAEQRTENRSDSERETAEELAEQQQEVEEATQETLESLIDYANTSELTDEDQRELARDADAASAQIQDAADRAEQAMDKANRAASDEDRSEALDQTAEALEDLTQALEQTADHFQKAEEGQDLAESREQLRQAEEALQKQNELDQRYDSAERMADAAESTPQELLEQLEQELQTNAPMQQELSEIAERAAESAQQSLEQAAIDERALNQALEQSDPEFQEKKRRAAKEIANLARRASSIDQSLLDKAERAVGWANIPQTRPKLDKARQELRDAVQKANELEGENALLSKMQETAEQMSKAIESSQQALEEVKQDAAQAEAENLHKDEASRKRAKDQLEGFARDARTQQIRAASTEKQQWSGAEREAGQRAQQAQRQKRNLENQKRQVESQMKRRKDNADSFKPRIAALEKQIDAAKRAEQASIESKNFSDQREKEAQQREQATKNQQLPALEKPNPAAELASRMSDQAGDELQQIQDTLGELTKQMDVANQLRVPPTQAEQLGNQQQRIAQQVDDATEQLRRAARHEERLGQQELSQQLDAAASAIEQQATPAVSEAAEALQQLGESSQSSPAANQSVAEATEQISQAAQQLAQLLGSAAPPENAQQVASGQDSSENGESSPNQERGEKMAQTLDELDRAIAQSQQEGQQGEGNQPGDPQQGEQAGQQNGEQPGQQPSQQPGQAQNAADASPTLADAMESQSQQAARQRQEQMNPNQTASSSNPASEPGSGQTMPEGGRVDVSGIDRLGKNWGQLRERRTEDATESRSATIAPQYRREIEAYFKAIAKRAAEKTE